MTRNSSSEGWDTVVIGSGPGGLVAALALARAGQRVLVLEQHYLPGGWTHSFTLEGHRFSPGVHYLGELGPGGSLRALYEGLGVARDLAFCEMNPDGFDHVLIEGAARFDVPRGFERYFARLCARFPHERAGLTRYFGVLRRAVAELAGCEPLLATGGPAALLLPLRAPTLLRWGWRSLEALLAATIRDPLLRGVLCAQLGNHGLSASRVSLPLHAAMVNHYFEGGYYPRGGAGRIPQAFIRALRQHGGQIRMRARVARIVLDGSGRAAGVELEGGERIAARAVVSNADPAHTFGRLLPAEVGARTRRRVDAMEYGVSTLSVFCAVDLPLRDMGYDSGNYWWYRHADVPGLYDRMERELPGATCDAVFVAITSLKDPAGHATRASSPSSSASSARRHVLELFTFVPYAPFARWAADPQGARSPEYNALKNELADKVLAAAERVIPGLARAVRFRAVGTPLTNDFYCETVRGAAYGTAKTPRQIGPLGLSVRTEVPGLYQCGASTLAHGVAGASLSGLTAARHVLGARRDADLLAPPDGSLRVVPAAETPARPSQVPARPVLDSAR